MALGAVLNIFGGHLMAMHQQRLGVVARRRRRGRSCWSCCFVPEQPPERSASCSPSASTTPASAAGRPRARSTGSWSCRWASCSPSTRSPGTTPSAHLSEETASRVQRRGARASGSPSSTPPSAAGSCCWPSCSRSRTAPRSPRINAGGGGGSTCIFGQALGQALVNVLILFISTAGQFFCATACMTSASRMMFAFSRDGAIPGSRLWSQGLTADQVPANAVHVRRGRSA